MTRFAPVLFGLLTLLCAGCGTPPKRSDVQTSSKTPDGPTFTFKLRVNDTGPQAQRVHLMLGVVPGNMVGLPNSKHFNDSTVGRGDTITLSAVEIESVLAAAASAANREEFVFEPGDTKVARLATMAANYWLGFEDPSATHSLMLVYVDRPCAATWGANHLAFKRPGLHWLQVDRPSSEAVESIRLIDTPEVIILDASTTGR